MAPMTSDAYRPLDLDRFRNAGLDVLPENTPRLLGSQQLLGLPFEIGEGFIAPREPIKIDVGQSACAVVIAHRLLDSSLVEGAPVGQTIAEYVFTLSDGSQHRVPIRERFEIADILGFG